MHFINCNALAANFSDATHLYISSLCFPDHVITSLASLLLDVPNLCVVAALSELHVLQGEYLDDRYICV